ncbi:MAG: hypothetical protein IJ057_08210 [Bacteroidales bacterium]|nr:hypothetical protein [Bacteroidales bacterium]
MKPKRCVIACLLGLAAMVACNRNVETRHGTSLPTDASPQLQAIDSLMWRQPDSALALLCCRDVACNVSKNDGDDSGDVERYVSTGETFDNHYANLLMAELLYKNDCEQTNREELLQAVDYFDSLCGRTDVARNVSTIFLDARAHYINGVGYYEKDSIVQACAEYLKALELMEGRFEEKELVGEKAKFMPYIYNRLGDMFEEQLLAEPAITCYKQALLYCRREPTSIYGIPVLLYSLGIQCDIENQKDSAAFYYDMALANMPDNKNIHYRDIITAKSVLRYDLGFCLDSVIKDLAYVISLITDDYERTHRF